MTRFKAALLAAAAIAAGLPAMAAAQERPYRGDSDHAPQARDQGDRGWQPRAPQQAQQTDQRDLQQRRDRGGDDRRQGVSGGYAGGPDRDRRDFGDARGGDRGRDVRDDRYRGGDRFAGGDRRWGGDWRRDGRYDWRGYRDGHRQAFRAPRYVAPRGWGYGYRRFAIGQGLPSFLLGQQYWIGDPGAYRLPPADGPYRWVRYYDDVLLIDLRSGQVVDMVPGFFW